MPSAIAKRFTRIANETPLLPATERAALRFFRRRRERGRCCELQAFAAAAVRG